VTQPEASKKPAADQRGESDVTRATSAFPPIFDGHNDTVLSMVKTGRSFFERSEGGHVDLPRVREGGMGGGFFALYIPDPVVVEKLKEGAPGLAPRWYQAGGAVGFPITTLTL
jgi:hypothetical protein